MARYYNLLLKDELNAQFVMEGSMQEIKKAKKFKDWFVFRTAITHEDENQDVAVFDVAVFKVPDKTSIHEIKEFLQANRISKDFFTGENCYEERDQSVIQFYEQLLSQRQATQGMKPGGTGSEPWLSGHHI